MSKTRGKAKAEPESITLTFDLFDLPTAQHKAGLAGLLLLIDWMRKRRDPPEKIPIVDEKQGTRTSARVTLTKASVQHLFDVLYAAKIVEIASPRKLPNASVKEERVQEKIDPKTGKKTSTRVFIYDVVQPTGSYLRQHLGGQDESPWLQLWREMIWAIPRGINTTRAPFNSCAGNEPCPEGGATWAALVKFEERRAVSEFATAPISSALLLSAQSANAEAVPFSGRIDHNFLLHFWQIVVLTYVPRIVKIDGTVKSRGYSLSIPDVSDLQDFCLAFPELLDSLPPERRGRRPADALIDLPVESSLEFLRHLLDLSTSKAGKASWSGSVAAVESFHMLKAGNNIKLLAFDRVANRPELVEEYERIRRTYRNPLFRVATLRSLLKDLPWYSELLEMFSEHPWPFFVESDKTPRFLPRFGTDARKRFRGIQKDYDGMKTDEIDDPIDRLSLIVQRLVYRYVEARAASKSGIDPKPLRKRAKEQGEQPRLPPEFLEAHERVRSDVFLTLRSRHDEDFVETFVGSICSVAQYIPKEDYRFLTTILMRKSQRSAVGRVLPCWEDVKALAMVAASACAYTAQAREPQESQPKEPRS